jgi:hypothetical protein
MHDTTVSVEDGTVYRSVAFVLAGHDWPSTLYTCPLGIMPPLKEKDAMA